MNSGAERFGLPVVIIRLFGGKYRIGIVVSSAAIRHCSLEVIKPFPAYFSGMDKMLVKQVSGRPVGSRGQSLWSAAPP